MTALLSSGCGTVAIHDGEWCGDLGKFGASCYHSLTPATRDIAKDAWDVERVGQVCTQGATLADLQAAIEKLCHQTKRCTYETKALLAAFGDHLRGLHAQLTE